MKPELYTRFFTDPQWGEVEEMILNHINPLLDMSTIDLTQPAEHVKAEIIGRTLAYNNLSDFLQQTGLVQRELPKIKNNFQ
jgi:hypothetical protein